MKSITINGVRWKMRMVSRLGTEDEPLAGTCDYQNKVIRIKQGQSRDEMRGTIMHEIIHACCPYLIEDVVAYLEQALVDGLKKAGEL